MNIRSGLAVGCLVLPTATNAILHGIDPLDAHDNAGLIAQAVAHPVLTSLMQLQYLLLLLAPGALLLAGLAQRRARRLAGWGGAVLCVAALANCGGLVENSVLTIAARSGDPQVWVTTFGTLDHAPGSAVLDACALVWILGDLVGFVLLGAALLRARAVPVWSGWTIIAAAALNVVGHLLATPYLIIIAWALLAVGLAACCARMGAVSSADAASAESWRQSSPGSTMVA